MQIIYIKRLDQVFTVSPRGRNKYLKSEMFSMPHVEKSFLRLIKDKNPKTQNTIEDIERESRSNLTAVKLTTESLIIKYTIIIMLIFKKLANEAALLIPVKMITN